MKNNGSNKDNVLQKKNGNSSDKKSFQLVFWLLAAKIGFILILAGLAFWLIYSVHSSASRNQAAVRFGKVHGSGFTESGDRLWIASNSGIVSYHNGNWKKEVTTKGSAGTQNLPVKDGYLQIGDNGMAVERSYDGHLIRSIPFSKKFPGGLWGTDDSAQTFYNLKSGVGKLVLSYSTDAGKNWSSNNLKGIKGKILMLAVHPEKADTFAIATTRGLFVTQDSGAHFQSYLNGKSVSSVSFAGGSDISLLAGTYGNDTALYSILPAHQKTINLEMDTVEGDRLVQISRSLVNKQEAAVLTESGDVYLTRNGGQNWVIIAQKGRGLSGS